VETWEILWCIGWPIITYVICIIYAPVMTWAERRICGWIQDRCGPNRVGPIGLFQPIADAIKLFFKEDMRPDRADRLLYTLAPGLVFGPPLIAFACLPLGKSFLVGGTEYAMQVGDLNVGILFLITVGSLAVYGISFGGWASNNKFSLLGSLRGVAQLISYELALGLSVITAVMIVGSLSPSDIVANQLEHGWLCLRMPLGFLIFLIAAFAETNRLPFDMPECECELVGGYHTEYSSMRFAMFPFGEYVAMTTMSGFMVLLWFGGWDIPFVDEPTITFAADTWTWGHDVLWAALPVLCYMLKILLILLFFVWVRWTFPRFRYDQLMALGWKVLVPLALFAVLLTGILQLNVTT
jgi:NADH-quinone oxidoreductase subunit H